MKTLNNLELALIRGALDTLGVALAARPTPHAWTDGERAIYEQAIALLEPEPEHHEP